MKSQCWGREAKPCLSECSGCCSLLKCQVLLKNNTAPLSFSLTFLPLPPLLPLKLQPTLEQRLRNEPLARLRQRGQTAAFLLPSEVFIYLFILFYFFPTSPLWPLRWRRRGWWNETISLFSCSHFPAAVTLLLLIPSISSPVSLDFSHDMLHALIGLKYRKHHQTHLFSKRQLHTTNYMVHFNCGVSAIAGEDGTWIMWWLKRHYIIKEISDSRARGCSIVLFVIYSLWLFLRVFVCLYEDIYGQFNQYLLLEELKELHLLHHKWWIIKGQNLVTVDLIGL